MKHYAWYSPAAHVARDRMVRVQMLVFAATLALYLLPLLTPDQLQSYSENWFCLPYLIAPTLAAVLAWRATRGTPEGPFWRTLAVALASWLAALSVYGFVPKSNWTPAWDASVNGLYLAYYVSALIAFDLARTDAEADPTQLAERRLRALGIFVFVSGWSLYGLVVPALATGTVAKKQIVGSVLFIIFDALLLARSVDAFSEAVAPRWRTILGAFSVVATLLLVTDVFNVLLSRQVLVWRVPGPADFWWATPGMALSIMIALRNAPLPDAPAPRPARLEAPLRPIRVQEYLVVGGVSFPLVHSALVLLGTVDATDLALLEAQLFTAMCSLAALAFLAIVAYRTLEKQRTHGLVERRRLESQLLQSQKMEAVGRLAGGVAHDFNNLLTAIGGYTDLVLDNMPAGDENRPSLEEIQSATARASALTKQLLTFSRRQVVAPQLVDVNSVVTNVERMLRRLIGEHIALKTELASGVVGVLIDPNQLEQVLMNLTVNARDAMPHGGRLTIATAGVTLGGPEAAAANLPPGRYAEVIVRDTGEGIPAPALPHLFEPFFTTKDRDKGTGLGLATVFGIVSGAKGAVEVTSEPGHGAAFRILLPHALAPVGEPGPAPGVPERRRTPRGRETILLVEDELAVLALVRSMLVSSGYSVITADNGDDALGAAHSHGGPIDLLLTDVVMPRMSGRELAERLARIRPDVPILFMTGYTDDDIVQHGLKMGTVDLIQKPFTSEVLCGRVRDSLDSHARRARGLSPNTAPH